MSNGTPAGSPSRVAVPLGIQIAVLVSGLVLLTLGGLAWISLLLASELLEREMNERALASARILAEAMPRVSHTESNRTRSIIFQRAPEDPTREWEWRMQQERKAWSHTFAELVRDPSRQNFLNICVTESTPLLAEPLAVRRPGRFRFVAA